MYPSLLLSLNVVLRCSPGLRCVRCRCCSTRSTW